LTISFLIQDLDNIAAVLYKIDIFQHVDKEEIDHLAKFFEKVEFNDSVVPRSNTATIGCRRILQERCGEVTVPCMKTPERGGIWKQYSCRNHPVLLDPGLFKAVKKQIVS
jgi:hypothetical protein